MRSCVRARTDHSDLVPNPLSSPSPVQKGSLQGGEVDVGRGRGGDFSSLNNNNGGWPPGFIGCRFQKSFVSFPLGTKGEKECSNCTDHVD